MNTRIGARLALIVAIVATIGCDRVTKHVAATTLAGTPSRSFLADTVRLSYVENTGGFLSLGANWPPAAQMIVFTIGTGLMLFGLVVGAIRFRRDEWRIVGVMLFLAGGTSNWVDRAIHGRVVDFMNVGVGSLRTGVFNVADIAIMLGVGVIIRAEFRPQRP